MTTIRRKAAELAWVVSFPILCTALLALEGVSAHMYIDELIVYFVLCAIWGGIIAHAEDRR